MNEKEEKTNQSEDEVNAYQILLQRHLNDDRLLAERSTIFLASNSILFLGFVMLPVNAWMCLRTIVCCIGLLLSILAFVGNRRTSKGLDFWEEKEEEIEQKGQRSFAYMKEKKMMPHLVYEGVNKGWLGWLRNRDIYAYWLPGLFVILWIASLIWVRLLN